MTPSIGLPESTEEETMEIDIFSSRFGDHLAVGPGQRIWGFPFHCSCWDLLIARRETHGAAQYEPQALFDVLRSFPRHRLVEFGHDYGGVAGWDIELDLFDIVEPSHQPCHLLPGEEPRLVYDRTDVALLQMQKQNPMCVAEIASVFRGEGPHGDRSPRHPQLVAYTMSPPDTVNLSASSPSSYFSSSFPNYHLHKSSLSSNPRECFSVFHFQTLSGALVSFQAENSTMFLRPRFFLRIATDNGDQYSNTLET